MRQSAQELGVLLSEGAKALARSAQIAANPLNWYWLRKAEAYGRAQRKLKIVLFQGFAAPSDAPLYMPLRIALGNAGYMVELNPLEAPRYHTGEATQLMMRLVPWVTAFQANVFIGHSYGGIIALHLAAELRLAGIAISSPIHGTPCRKFQEIAERYTRLATFDERWKLERMLQSVSERRREASFLTIGSEEDKLIQPTACRIRGIPYAASTGNHGDIVITEPTLSAVGKFLTRQEQLRLRPVAA